MPILAYWLPFVVYRGVREKGLIVTSRPHTPGWPLHDIVTTSIECCMAYKRGVGEGRALSNSRAIVLQ